MLSRTERLAWSAVAAVLVAGAVAAWFTRDDWLPQAGPWLEELWLKSTRPSPDTLPHGKQPVRATTNAKGGNEPPPPPPRKCVGADGRVTYTNTTCPKGTREQAVDGALSVLPQ